MRPKQIGCRRRPHLGDAAQTWYTAITTPPPSLRAKLGLDRGAKALLYGECDDPELAAALDGVLADDGAHAAMLVACITGPEDLAAAEAVRKRRRGHSTIIANAAVPGPMCVPTTAAT